MSFDEWWEEYGWIPTSDNTAAKQLAQEAWEAAQEDK
jgi:hypothetical protein